MPSKKLKVESGKLKVKTQSSTGRLTHISNDAKRALSENSSSVSSSLSENRQSKVNRNKKSKSVPTFSSFEIRDQSPIASSANKNPKSSPHQNLKIDVYDIKGKVVEAINLPKEVFGAKVNKSLIAQAVRVYLANQRRGSASTKTRGEVAGSTRKIYRQKGTGRARHGSLRAPIFVHGGIVFGPKPRDYSLKFPRKMKKAALFSALSAKVKDKEIKIIKGLEDLMPKTKLMADVLKKLELTNKVLLVLPEKTENISRASRNIEGVSTTLADQLNTYEVLRNKMLLFTKKSIESLNKVSKGE